MRQKVIDYLESPNKKLWADLTSEERKYIERVKGVAAKVSPNVSQKASAKS